MLKKIIPGLLLSLAVATTGGTAQTSASPPLRVGMVYHGAGKFDAGFNQNAYEGSQRAARELGVQVKDFEAPDPSQIIQGIRAFAKESFDLIISLGVASGSSITQAAREYPNLQFGLTETVSAAPNVASLIFRHEEGSYLVGYLAALNSSTGVVGFVGGMDIPLLHRYQAGFEAGAKAAHANITVIAQYLGTTPDAWNNPSKAKEIAASMRSRGADILFAVAGGSGRGVIEYVNQTQCLKAVQLPSGMIFKSNNFASVPKSVSYQQKCAGDTRPMFFIGVDSNQNPLGDFDKNPATLNHGLTSMRVYADRAIYNLIRERQKGQFKGGERGYGLKEGGVGYVIDEYNHALIPSSQLVKLETLRASIVRGLLKVPQR